MNMIDKVENQHHQAGGNQDWYQIEVEGRINSGWFDGLDGWKITPLPGGNTLLSAWVIDQPALHGLFARLRDMNVRIISLSINPAPSSKATLGAIKPGC